MTEKSIIVAVYGSLRRGERANRMLQFSEYLGQDTVKGRLYDLGAYPGLIVDPKGDDVVVELYSIDAETLANLDRYEGAPHLFRQVKTQVNSSNKEVLCYEYCHKVAEASRLPHGDWTRRETAGV